MPIISVIVPVYKAEAYLPDCIGSILSQTYSDFEVILVDDGSPDNCYAICQEYAARDSRIRVMQQENQGQAAARNHAMTCAAGEWICFVDSDDLIHPQTLELLYNAAADSGAAISMCEMLEGSELPEDFGKLWDSCYEVYTVDEATLVKLHDAEAYPSWVACAKLIRRELIEAYPFCEGRVFEDNEAVCHWVCEAKCLAKLSHPLYFYRKNPESTTKSCFSLKKLDYLWALERITRYYDSLGYTELKARFAQRYVEAAISACYGARYELDRPDVVKSTEKQLRSFLRKENLRLTKEQLEALLDVAHPKLIRIYWPLEGVLRTLKKTGVSGVIRKITNHLRKEEAE